MKTNISGCIFDLRGEDRNEIEKVVTNRKADRDEKLMIDNKASSRMILKNGTMEMRENSR